MAFFQEEGAMQKRNGNCIAPRDLGILCYVSTPAQVAPHGKDTRDKSYAPPYSISAAHPAHWAISVLSNFGSTILASSFLWCILLIVKV